MHLIALQHQNGLVTGLMFIASGILIIIGVLSDAFNKKDWAIRIAIRIMGHRNLKIVLILVGVFVIAVGAYLIVANKN